MGVKHLKDYFVNMEGERGQGQMWLASVGETWSRLMSEMVKEIVMDEEEYYYFFCYFIGKFPYDWDGKTFMGVKILREIKTLVH